MMTEEDRNSEGGKKLMQQSIDNMKIATRRYARRQNKMVKGRFLEIPTREVQCSFHSLKKKVGSRNLSPPL